MTQERLPKGSRFCIGIYIRGVDLYAVSYKLVVLHSINKKYHKIKS